MLFVWLSPVERTFARGFEMGPNDFSPSMLLVPLPETVVLGAVPLRG